MGPSELVLLLVVACVAGGVLPLLVRDSHRLLHLLLCLAAGFFLGVVFLHLLPELTRTPGDGDGMWGWVLAGLLAVLVLDLGIFGKQSHAAVGWATLIGLTVHALAMGLSLGVIGHFEAVLAWALVPHKFGEAFSLTSALRFTVDRKRTIFWILVLFSLATPAGMLLAGTLLGASSGELGPVVAAIAAGSFLYVAVGDLLPEVFHEAEDRFVKLVLLLAGVGFAALSAAAEHAGHGHAHGSAETATWVETWLATTWTFFAEAAPFLLLGFFVAALVRAYMPAAWLRRRLGRNDLGSVLMASAVGAPLPLCSCSVLPTAMSLRERGASKGATVAFLVSTPETSVDSIGVTWALMDPVMTVLRPLAAIVSATVAGITTNLVDPDEPADPVRPTARPDPGAAATDDLAPARGPATTRLRDGMRFSFVDMFDDIMPSLLAGIAIAGVFAVLLPDGFLAAPWASGWPGLVLAAVIGVPIYVCASASTPIAVALMLKGLSPGAALVFLLVGPATNLGSLFALNKMLGRRTVLAYALSVVLCAIAFGAGVDHVYGWLGTEPGVRAAGDEHGTPGLALAAAVVLAGLCLAALWRRGWLRKPFGHDASVAPGPEAAD